jgi:tetratricopeptide (TPR) repeat protein
VLAGRYVLGRPLGEGGMGAVYHAEQTHPVRREVAVKLIRPGMDSERVVARFEAERQALAVMDHPNIAKVLDAGTTDDGRPFFVMELVHGAPLTAYCDAHRMTVRDRLGLFAQVCAAVQHAHQKGVIHRDLKPGNILVAEVDGRPVPKVIDFGLAKALAGDVLPDLSLDRVGGLLGTVQYMAPEQAGAGGPDVDTRADVYALGVVLYELLTGTTPLDRAAVRDLPLDEVVRRVREQEPPPPARRLGESGGAAVAAARGVDPDRLRRLLRGDLEWVTLRCLEKDRARRYDTAAALAADVRRFLADEPVSAGPPSRWYKARKFVRRNRGTVTAAAVVLVALVGGVVGTSVGLYRAERQRVEAVTAWAAEAERAEGERRAKLDAERAADEERKAKELALRQRDQIRRGIDALGSVFRDLNLRKLDQAGERLEVALGRRLKAVAAGLTAESVGDPLVVAELQNVLGVSLLHLGHHAEAVGLLEEARATRSRLLGPEHVRTVAATSNLAEAYHHAGRADRAVALHGEVLASRRAAVGPDHPDTLFSMSNLAGAYQGAGEPGKALALYEEVLGLQRVVLGPDHPDTLLSAHNLAEAYRLAGKVDRAVALQVEALARMRAVLGRDHPDTLMGLNNLAIAYKSAGKFDQAVALHEEALARMKERLGPTHPATLTAMANLASAYEGAGRADRAAPLQEEALRGRRERLGPDHPDTLFSMSNLAGAYWSAGQFDRSVPLYEEVLRRREARLGRDHPETLATVTNLGVNYHSAGRLADALPLLEEAVARMKVRLGPDHPDTLWSMDSLAAAYRDAGRKAEALALLQEVFERRRAALGPEHPAVLRAMNGLATTYWSAGRLDRSVPLFEEALKLQEARLGRGHPDTLVTVANLGVNYKDAGRLAEAIPLLEEAHRASARHPGVRWVGAQLLDGYAKAGKAAEAAALARAEVAEARRVLPNGGPPLADVLAHVGRLLLDARAWADAEPILRECLAVREKAQPDAPATFDAKSLLGGALLGQGKYADAEPLLLAGYEGMKRHEKGAPPQGRGRLPEAADRLVELYAAWGKPDEVARWRTERAKYPPPREGR